jgi:general secretion pathway protein H
MLQYSPRRRPLSGVGGFAHAGFTLIEILVAMVIVGVLATSVVLTLPDSGLGQRQASVRAWQALAESAALRAEAQAQPYAWEVSEGQARLWVLEGNQWRAPLHPAIHSVALAEGLAVEQLESEGQRLPLGSRIVFAGTPPLFTVRISGHGRRWQLDGQPNGSIRLAESSFDSATRSP